MQTKKRSQLFRITLVYENGMTRTVPVKASNRQVAEERALKRNPNAMRVKRGV